MGLIDLEGRREEEKKRERVCQGFDELNSHFSPLQPLPRSLPHPPQSPSQRGTPQSLPVPPLETPPPLSRGSTWEQVCLKGKEGF